MATQVLIPAPLRAYTGKKKSVTLEGATVGEVLAALVAAHPDLKPQLYDARGTLRRFVNVYLNDEDIRYLAGDQSKLAPGDTVQLIPSVSGG
jgi:molybdopterin converting factor small subunit